MCNPLKDNEDYLRKTASEAGISPNVVVAMFQDCNYDKEKLAHRISNPFEYEMPKVTVYANGMLVNDRFYDFSDPDNVELKKMLDRNEFDREVLGMSGKFTDLLVESRNDYYREDLPRAVAISNRAMDRTLDNVKKLKIGEGKSPRPIRFKYVVGKGKVPMSDTSYEDNTPQENGLDTKKETTGLFNLPQDIRLDEFGTVKFKLVCINKSTTVFASEKMTIGNLIAYIKDKTGETVTLSRRGEILDENELVAVLKNCMVDVIL